jgi:hypothetical protein
MSQHDYVLDNQSGSNFRTDLNNALLAVVSKNSGNSAPSTTYAYMWWNDTSGANPILKLRNSANNAWITIGRLDQEAFGLNYLYSGAAAPTTTQAFMFWVDTTSGAILKLRNAANSAWITLGDATAANLGLLSLSGGTLTGAILASNTDRWRVPVGTTAQRPGTPINGDIRFNTDLVQFEGYNGTAWAPIGGGGYTVTAVANITAAGTISSSTTDQRQLRHVQGNSASVTTSTTPFGTGGTWKDGTEITLVGNDDTNSVIIPYNDAANGCVGNFSTLELTKYKIATFIWSASLTRWILSQGA